MGQDMQISIFARFFSLPAIFIPGSLMSRFFSREISRFNTFPRNLPQTKLTSRLITFYFPCMRMKTARMTWSLLNYGASAFANDDNIYQNDRVPSRLNILLTRSVLELRRFEINGRGLFWPKICGPGTG